MELYCIKHQHQETINHLNTALQIATDSTCDTNTQYLHNKTKVLPMDTHLKVHATQLKLIPTQTHFLHDLNAYSDPPRNMKATIFYNNEHTNIIISKHLRNAEKPQTQSHYHHLTIPQFWKKQQSY